MFCIITAVLIAAGALSGCASDKSASSAVKEAAKTESSVAAVEAISDPSHYFDDAVFVGDSVSLMLENYSEKQRSSGEDCLGKAGFLTAGSLGWSNSLWAADQAPLPSLYGQAVRIDDGIKQLGAKKAYIMLGMNDLSYEDSAVMTAMNTLMDNIEAKSPGIKVYIQSVTPIIKSKEGDVSNSRIDEFNVILKKFAQDRDYRYLDVASVMRGDDGYLRDEYCGDPEGMGIHFNNISAAIWVEFLKNNL